MNTVALISGGKDSCFNMMHCVAEGHSIVALANLRPKDKDELDSYMYQTVGHQAIELYAEAMGLPLFRRTIQGTALHTGRDYQPHEEDEVEDLYQLLCEVKKEVEIEAVSVGAILSDYQRVRVENVCLRLGLTPLAYLWRRDQTELLTEMVQCGMDAILIKVAAMGLEPERHLGKSLSQIFPYMVKMEKQFGLNVCGEGGEYETFTLDCPLFRKKIVVDERENVIHSDDAFAPVGYTRFKKLHLEDKGEVGNAESRLKGLPLNTSSKQMDNLRAEVKVKDVDVTSLPTVTVPSVPPLTDAATPCCRTSGSYFYVGGVMALMCDDLTAASRTAMETLKMSVESLGSNLSDVFSVCLFVRQMSDFAAINAVYKSYFDINPPVRICVGACLPENVLFQLECQGWRGDGGGGGEVSEGERRTMHVQGISHWAPANIGPYSQATALGGRVFVAGQVPLVPGTMSLVPGGAGSQCILSLRHAGRVVGAMCPGRGVADALLCVCYLTHPDLIPTARETWRQCTASGQDTEEVLMEETTLNSIVEYVVVPSLPRAASVEWQIYARCQETPFKDFRCSLEAGMFRVDGKILQSEETPAIFTASVSVFCQDDGNAMMEAESAVTACLEGYSRLLQQQGLDWSDVPLLRVFYPAALFSHSSLLLAWRQLLDSRWSGGVAVSVVPVVQLAEGNRVLLLCH